MTSSSRPGVTAAAGGPAAAPDAGAAVAAGRGRSRLDRALTAGTWAAAALTAFAVYLRLAQTRAVNSDGASIALAAWDMLHGNVLLSSWRLADVTFYSTEVPQYALIELAHGLNADVVPIGAAMTYTLVLLFAALLAKGTATGRAAAGRIALAVGIMLAPQLGPGTDVLLSSPDHIGTSVPLLAALLILDRVRPPRRWVPVAVSALLAWAALADSVVLVAAVVPVVVVCGFRVLAFRPAAADRRFASRWYEIWLAAGAVAAAIAARVGYLVINAAGGYTERPLGTELAPLHQLFGHNLPVAAQGLLLLPGADFLGLPAGAATSFVLLHLAGVAAAAAGLALAAWRFGRREADLVNQLLLAGVVVAFAAYVVTTHVFFTSSAREIAPTLPFAAVLAGRELVTPFAGPRRARVRLLAAGALVLVLGGYLAGLGLELTAPAAPPQDARLTAWLESHPLGTGLSTYWQANVVTLTSGGRVAVRPATVSGGRLAPTVGQVKPAWFDPAVSRVDYVVLFGGISRSPGEPGYPGFTDRKLVVAQFGRPDRVYRVGPYTILWWSKNLLDDVRWR